jgi:hypothetical protein
VQVQRSRNSDEAGAVNNDHDEKKASRHRKLKTEIDHCKSFGHLHDPLLCWLNAGRYSLDRLRQQPRAS